MFQLDLNSDLKKELDLNSSCWFTKFGPVIEVSRICLVLLKYCRMWAIEILEKGVEYAQS